MEFRFRKEIKDIEERRKEYEKTKLQFPDKIIIICEKDPKYNIKALDETKYIVDKNMSVSEFSSMISRKIEIPYDVSLFVNGTTYIPFDKDLIDVYDNYHDKEDEFLYIAYTNIFELNKMLDKGNNMEFIFKEENKDVDKIREIYRKIKAQFPKHIPIICKKDPNSHFKDIGLIKFAIPSNLNISIFNSIIRKKLQVTYDVTLLVNGEIPVSRKSNLIDIYEKYQNKDDGFLYITYDVIFEENKNLEKKNYMEFTFKQENKNAEKRRESYETIMVQFVDKIPIIFEKDPQSSVSLIGKKNI